MIQLRRFYAVTLNSIYEVVSPKKGMPFARRIRSRNTPDMDIPPNYTLKGGSMVAITDCIRFYTPEGGGYSTFERNIEKVNMKYWGASSSPIVALFMTKNGAINCFESSCLEMCDSRWFKNTTNVIKKIGFDHPVFEVCYYPGFCLSFLNL